MLHRFSVWFNTQCEVCVICKKHLEVFLKNVAKEGYSRISVSEEELVDARCAFCKTEEQVRKDIPK